jgi:branched-chain amino acid transport system substrate-binding protein
VLPAGPMLVYEQLPDSNAVKASAGEYVRTYEAKYGPGSRTTFGGHAWDAYTLLQRAIPEALKTAQPGTKAFRAALRDALENAKNVAGSNGIFNMSAADHNGMDNRARVIVRIENGKWVLSK